MDLSDKDTLTESESNSDSESQPAKLRAHQVKKKNYAHKFKLEWMEDPTYKSWLNVSKKGSTYFHCKICNGDYIGGIAAIKKHGNRNKHVKKAAAVKIQPPVTKLTKKSVNIEKKTKEVEILITSFLVEHNIAITVVDHLVKLLQRTAVDFGEEVLKNISCNRTKCTAIIKNVTGAYGLDVLVSKLKQNKFSMLIDESTDCSCVKSLAVVVRMVSPNLDIEDSFFALQPIANATANNIYETIVNLFTKYEIPYKQNLIGFAADGASTMMGRHHSVKTLLEKDVPHIFVMKCLCHSLALCSSYACAKLPNEIESFVRKIYNYFSYSYKRQDNLKEFQEFVNTKPHKLLQPSQTRWLSVISAITRILEQFEALKLYFQSEYLEDEKEECEHIYSMLCDPFTKQYLHFLEYFLPFFTKLNLEFQSESVKIHTVYSRMSELYKTILDCYLNPDYLKNTELADVQYRNPRNYCDLKNVYLGPKVAIFMSEKNISEHDKDNFKKHCLNFLVECAAQIYKRFPFNLPDIKGLSFLSIIQPQNLTKINSIAPTLSAFPILTAGLDVNDLDREYRQLRNMNFEKTDDPIEFWRTVTKLQRGDGQLLFATIAVFVSRVFCLPHSSAAVERIFSSININKSKSRNRLGIDTISGIMHTKNTLKNETCYSFKPDMKLINKHCNKMY